jgi:hypothetical protein
MSLKDFGLPFQTLQLALTGMVLGRYCGLRVLEARIGPGRLCGLCSCCGLILKPLQAAIKELKAALHGGGLLPRPLAVKRGQGGDRLGEAAKVSDKSCDKLGERTPTRPGFGKKPFERFFGIVMGQPGGAAGVRQKAC